MRDIHAMEPTSGRFELHQVGLSGIRKPLTIRRPDRVVTLTATFDLTVDLPSTRKGSDLSRNAILLVDDQFGIGLRRDRA